MKLEKIGLDVFALVAAQVFLVVNIVYLIVKI